MTKQNTLESGKEWNNVDGCERGDLPMRTVGSIWSEMMMSHQRSMSEREKDVGGKDSDDGECPSLHKETERD
jgi:hypothetical protein